MRETEKKKNEEAEEKKNNKFIVKTENKVKEVVMTEWIPPVSNKNQTPRKVLDI